MGLLKFLRPLAAVGLAASLCVSLIGGMLGCARGALDSEDSWKVQLTAEAVSLDPALAEDGIALRILANVMDGLLGYDGAGELKYLLAESSVVEDQGKRYRFILRPGARWSDGREVRAQDFVAGMRRSLGPKMGAKLAPLFDGVVGARDYRTGKAGPEGLGIRDEKGELVFQLIRPLPFFLQSLTLPVAMPVREELLAAADGKWTRDMPVTGRYRISAHQVERQISLEPNPRHWSVAGLPGGKPDWRKVDLKVVTDESTALSLFETGALDVLLRVPALDLARLRKKGRVRNDPYFAVYYLAFNVKRGPFQDRELRRAFSGAIDREDIIEVLGTEETPARSWVPLGLEGSLPWSERQLKSTFEDSLRKVKARGPKGLPPVEVAYDASSRNAIVLERVQNDLGRKLGWKVTLRPSDWKTHVRSLSAEAPAVFRFGWSAPFRDPILPLRVFTTGDPSNYGGYSNPEYDALVRQIEGLQPGPERVALIVKAQTLLVDKDAAVVPLYHYVQTTAVSDRVRGFRANPFGIVPFWEMK